MNLKEAFLKKNPGIIPRRNSGESTEVISGEILGGIPKRIAGVVARVTQAKIVSVIAVGIPEARFLTLG